MVALERLVAELGGSCASAGCEDVVDVTLDSRSVQPGTLFCALSGGTRHGREFVTEACARGAAAILSAEPLGASVPNWVHPDARVTCGRAAAIVHGRPSTRQTVIAITGTNGKTTTALLVADLLAQAGLRPGVLGTLGYRLADGHAESATHTTPDAARIQAFARRNLDCGGDALVLEASSHALVQDRLSGLDVDIAVFTNLTPDHLDHHGTFEDYARAKELLFRRLRPGALAIVNAADPASARMADAARAAGAEVLTYSAGSRADLTAWQLDTSPTGTRFNLAGIGVSQTRVRIPLLGSFNVANALAALAAVLKTGASSSDAVEGLATVSPVPGRLEPIPTGERGFALVVDFAHTEAALASLLDLARTWLEPSQRLLCVFGCGGDRDATKRGPMGRAVAERADVAIITNDNPRGEDPAVIADAILAGARGSSRANQRAEIVVELDRRAAIRAAIERARPGDLVVLAGKGHEAQQISCDGAVPFDDRVVAREELA